MNAWEDFCKINNVGVRFRDVQISKCDKIDRSIIDMGIDWCENPHSLLIHGKAGRGKTHFTFSLIRQALRKFHLHSIYWTKSKAMDDRILQAHNQYGDTSYTIKAYCESHILFIDDFGVDRSSERTERDYYEIIDNRWENMKPTVITTNLTPEKLEEVYGARIFSRLKDSKWIHFDGQDLRGGH